MVSIAPMHANELSYDTRTLELWFSSATLTNPYYRWIRPWIWQTQIKIYIPFLAPLQFLIFGSSECRWFLQREDSVKHCRVARYQSGPDQSNGCHLSVPETPCSRRWRANTCGE